MRLFEAEQSHNGRMSCKMISNLKCLGEPYLLKGRRRVRVGAVGKVPLVGNSLAAYHVP